MILGRPAFLPVLAVLASGLLTTGCASVAPPAHPALTQIWRLDQGLASPESVVVDPASGDLLVSSMNGRGDTIDGNGYLSRVSSSGVMLDERWLTGLDAPKGLAVAGGVVFGTDIQTVFAADLATGTLRFKRTVEGATYLNDTAVGAEGTVWVSDARGHGIWQVGVSRERLVHASSAMLRPNGLTDVGGRLHVLAGSPGEGDPGERRAIMALDGAGPPRALSTTPADFGAADGLESDGRGGFFVTTNAAREVIHVRPDGASTVLATLDSNTTDLHFDARSQRLYVPLGRAGALVAYAVTW